MSTTLPDHIQTSDPQSLLALPFDHYGRYALTRAILRHLGDTATLSVLDVGGHSSPLKHFVPEAMIVLTDVEPVGSLTSVEFQFDAYVRSSGAALPFRADAFDVVTAHDTLEHVPPAYRTAFMDELVRVASHYAVLTGPVGDEATVRAESRLDSFVRNTLHWDQPFLREHIDLGLPTRGFIEDYFRGHKMPFVRIANGNLGRWLMLQSLRHYLAALPDSEAAREALDSSYNTRYPVIDGEGACYRQTYVAAISLDGTAALDAIAAAFPPTDESGGEDEIQALTAFVDALEAHAGTVEQHISSLHSRIFDAEHQAFDARQANETLTANLTERDAQLHQARLQIESLTEEIGRSLPNRIRRAIRRITGRR